MMEVAVTTGAIRRAKFQLNCHHQQTNTQCFTGWMPFLSPNQQCQSAEGIMPLDHKAINFYHMHPFCQFTANARTMLMIRWDTNVADTAQTSPSVAFIVQEDFRSTVPMRSRNNVSSHYEVHHPSQSKVQQLTTYNNFSDISQWLHRCYS